jgi:hypothetical protein
VTDRIFKNLDVHVLWGESGEMNGSGRVLEAPCLFILPSFHPSFVTEEKAKSFSFLFFEMKAKSNCRMNFFYRNSFEMRVVHPGVEIED